MSSPSVLIFHAPDGLKEAVKIQDFLATSGFQATTLSDFKVAQDQHLSAGEIFTLAVNSFDVVLSLVTDGLFANCYMAFAIGIAMGQKKIISVSKPYSQVIVPTWYASAFRNYSANATTLLLTLNQHKKAVENG